MPKLQAPRPPTHHPAEPQAGLTGSADGDAGGGHVRGRLQRLDDPRGLTEGPGADDVHLPHSEPAARGDAGKWKEQNHTPISHGRSRTSAAHFMLNVFP